MICSRRVVLVIGAWVLVSLACGVGASGVRTEVVDTNATGIALGVEATRNARAKATLEMSALQSTAEALSGMAAQPAATVQAAPPTAAALPPTPVPLPTEAVLIPPTLEPGSEATAQAQPLYAELEKLLENSAIRSIEGSYYPVEDFKQAVYDPKTIESWSSGYMGGDFVIRADVAWRANDPSDTVKSGCGFLYGLTSRGNYHATILAPDGVVHTYRQRGSEQIEMKGGRYPGSLGMSSGKAEILMVLQNKTMAFFVNGRETVRFKDPYFETGEVEMTVLTGSFKGFECTMTNIGFWELE